MGQLSLREQERLQEALDLDPGTQAGSSKRFKLQPSANPDQYSKRSPLLVDSRQRAYYSVPGQHVVAKIAVVTLEQRGGERLVPDVPSAFNQSKDRKKRTNVI